MKETYKQLIHQLTDVVLENEEQKREIEDLKRKLSKFMNQTIQNVCEDTYVCATQVKVLNAAFGYVFDRYFDEWDIKHKEYSFEDCLSSTGKSMCLQNGISIDELKLVFLDYFNERREELNNEKDK